MTSILLPLDDILDHLLRILLPLPMSPQLLLNIVFIKIRLLQYSTDYQLLQILRQTEELLLVNRIDQRLSR